MRGTANTKFLRVKIFINNIEINKKYQKKNKTLALFVDYPNDQRNSSNVLALKENMDYAPKRRNLISIFKRGRGKKIKVAFVNQKKKNCLSKEKISILLLLFHTVQQFVSLFSLVLSVLYT